jgi:hypothetical protein
LQRKRSEELDDVGMFRTLQWMQVRHYLF